MNKVLVCGYGKMGKLYGKYLSQHNVTWDWYDPNLGRGLINSEFTHIIIASPSHTHYNCYQLLKNKGKYFLIEKPVVVSYEELSIFDCGISCGMVERFNPVIQSLVNIIEPSKVISVKFMRSNHQNSTFSELEEIGIHDLDLYYYLFGEFPEKFDFKKNHLFFSEPFLVEFVWNMGGSFDTSTLLVVHQTNMIINCDLRAQIIVIQQGTKSETFAVGKKYPLEEELLGFLGGVIVDAKKSHIFMLRLMDESKIVPVR